MEFRSNCKNCGAPLHYDRSDYGKVAKCSYCDTEYHIDLLGRIEEYKVKLEFMGEIKEYYIGDWEMHRLDTGVRMNFDGRLSVGKPIFKSKLTLIEL